jgi:hypothetical protein
LAFDIVGAGVHAISEHSLEANFMRGCTGAGGPESKCRCSWNWIHKNVPESEFRAFDKRASQPGYTSAENPPWVAQAVNACRYA